MFLPVLKYPDPRLKHVSKPIDTITETHKTLAANMIDTMYKEEGIGLAAPQVGESIRLIVVDVSGPEARSDLLTLVNPTLTALVGSPTVETEEGCLSVEGYRSKVKRHAKVRVQALDLEGQPLDFEADGLLAICLQHEVDHLDGKLFIDRISRLKRGLFDSKVRKQSMPK